LRDGAPVAVSVDVGPSDGIDTAVSGDIAIGDKAIVGSQTAS
jgi:hypothetical protein